jgi:hypothetical protein
MFGFFGSDILSYGYSIKSFEKLEYKKREQCKIETYFSKPWLGNQPNILSAEALPVHDLMQIYQMLSFGVTHER